MLGWSRSRRIDVSIVESNSLSFEVIFRKNRVRNVYPFFTIFWRRMECIHSRFVITYPLSSLFITLPFLIRFYFDSTERLIRDVFSFENHSEWTLVYFLNELNTVFITELILLLFVDEQLNLTTVHANVFFVLLFHYIS